MFLSIQKVGRELFDLWLALQTNLREEEIDLVVKEIESIRVEINVIINDLKERKTNEHTD